MYCRESCFLCPNGRVFSVFEITLRLDSQDQCKARTNRAFNFCGGSVFLSFLKDFETLIRPFIPKIRRAAGWVVLLQLGAMCEPYMTMQIVNVVVEHGVASEAMIEPLCGLMLTMLIFLGFVNIAKNRFIRDVWLQIEHDLPLLGGTKLLSLPYVYHQTENTGLIVGKMVRGVTRTGEIVGIFLFEVFPLLTQTIVTATLLMYYSPRSALIFVPVFLVFVTITAIVKLKWAPYRIKRHKLDTVADEILGQAVMNVMTTQAFAQESRELNRVRMIRDRIIDLAQPEFHAYDQNDFVRNALVSVGRVGVLYVCAKATYTGTFSLGHLVFVVTLAEKVFINCYRIGAIFDRAMEAVDAVHEINQILAEPDTVPDPEHPVTVPRRLTGSIKINAISYAYRGKRDGKEYRSTHLALDQVTLEIPAGSVVAVVGESGSGKSTLAKLLIRCDDPTSGTITMDGIDLRHMRRNDLRRQFGYVLQEVEIYDLSISQNIAYGRPDATQSEVEQAARLANAHEFIMRLEEGYETKVGNRGLKLSGGQRQRVGIARAWLIDPPVIILDEATSNVDVESELKIQQSMERMRHGRAMIIIAHRLSTVRNADFIVVMHNGCIEEIGTHTELLRENGIYHRLVNIQTHEAAIT